MRFLLFLHKNIAITPLLWYNCIAQNTKQKGVVIAMNTIIHYLLIQNQYLLQIILYLFNFICKYIPLKQWWFDDSNSPKYQKFKVDEPPIIIQREVWFYKDFISYIKWRYGYVITPVKRRSICDIPDDFVCPYCNAPKDYLYKNNGSHNQVLCKVCGRTTYSDARDFSDKIILRCPHCSHALAHKKDRKHFIIHKCVNPKCSYYLHNLKKVDKKHINEPFGKNKYKLHYIYREFTVDFFKMDISSLPKNSSSLKFTKHSSYIMSLCLTMHVNLGLSLRKTAQALKDLYNINISHQQVANYARTAALVIKPFVDNYDYEPSNTMTADETYIKVRGVKGYVWFIMDAVKRSILGYQVSDNRSVGPCILAMRMALRNFKEKLPQGFKFIADGYSAYPLAAQQFFIKYGKRFKFDITQVIGLTNDDAVSKEFRPYKQLIERLNRTFKASYRVKCGYDNFDGANYDLALWVAYYNFLRPHSINNFRVLNSIEMLESADTMPDKWILLIYLGQKTILNLQNKVAEG